VKGKTPREVYERRRERDGDRFLKEKRENSHPRPGFHQRGQKEGRSTRKERDSGTRPGDHSRGYKHLQGRKKSRRAAGTASDCPKEGRSAVERAIQQGDLTVWEPKRGRENWENHPKAETINRSAWRQNRQAGPWKRKQRERQKGRLDCGRSGTKKTENSGQETAGGTKKKRPNSNKNPAILTRGRKKRGGRAH